MKRILSIDILRGITILAMLLVNNIALDSNTPAQLLHAPWNGGITLTDLVFPWFLFCVGASIPFSRSSALRKNTPGWLYELKIIRRAVLIFLLGMLIESSVAGQITLSLDVLQLIALSYLAGAFLYDIPWIRRILIAGIMLVSYWGIIKFLPIPGAGSGFFQQDMNIIVHLNNNYLSQINLAGILSVIPTSALVIIGSLFGDVFLIEKWSEVKKTVLLVSAGCLLMAAGYYWNFDVPFNKSVWTPSFILFTAGFAAVVLAFLHVLTDNLKFGMIFFPLTVFGSNAIFAYSVPILVKNLILQNWTMAGTGGQTVQQVFYDFFFNTFGRINGGWAYTFSYILFWWLIMALMYQKKLFVRL